MKNVLRTALYIIFCFNLILNPLYPILIYAQDQIDPGSGSGSSCNPDASWEFITRDDICINGQQCDHYRNTCTGAEDVIDNCSICQTQPDASDQTDTEFLPQQQDQQIDQTINSAPPAEVQQADIPSEPQPSDQPTEPSTTTPAPPATREEIEQQRLEQDRLEQERQAAARAQAETAARVREEAERYRQWVENNPIIDADSQTTALNNYQSVAQMQDFPESTLPPTFGDVIQNVPFTIVDATSQTFNALTDSVQSVFSNATENISSGDQVQLQQKVDQSEQAIQKEDLADKQSVDALLSLSVEERAQQLAANLNIQGVNNPVLISGELSKRFNGPVRMQFDNGNLNSPVIQLEKRREAGIGDFLLKPSENAQVIQNRISNGIDNIVNLARQIKEGKGPEIIAEIGQQAMDLVNNYGKWAATTSYEEQIKVRQKLVIAVGEIGLSAVTFGLTDFVKADKDIAEEKQKLDTHLQKAGYPPLDQLARDPAFYQGYQREVRSLQRLTPDELQRVANGEIVNGVFLSGSNEQRQAKIEAVNSSIKMQNILEDAQATMAVNAITSVPDLIVPAAYLSKLSKLGKLGVIDDVTQAATEVKAAKNVFMGTVQKTPDNIEAIVVRDLERQGSKLSKATINQSLEAEGYPLNRIDEAVERVAAVVNKPDVDSTQINQFGTADEVASRLTDVSPSTLKIGDKTLGVKVGFDPQRADEIKKGLTLYFEPGQVLGDNVKFTNKAGEVVNLGEATSPVLFSEIDTVTIDGVDYIVRNDAWLNPALYKKYDEVLNPEFKPLVERVAELWDTAAKRPDQIDQCLQNCLTPQAYEQVTQIVDYIKANPDIQRLQYDQVNPWELAALPAEKANEILSKLNSPFRETEEFTKVTALVEKIRIGQPLSEDDIRLAATLQNLDIALSKSIKTVDLLTISDLTEQYALANLAENELVKAAMPQGAFETHQKMYVDFIKVMEDRGVKIPDWFKPYSGDEFRYGIRLDGIIANAAGIYFLDHELETSEYVARILTHERVHKLEGVARQFHSGYARAEGITSYESYTDAMALLVKHKGDIAAALADPMIEDTSYKTGVVEVLRMAQAVNRQSGDNLKSTELLLQGLIDLSKGGNKNLAHFEAYYDTNVARGGKTFAQRMEPFSDDKLARFSKEVPQPESLPVTRITEALHRIRYEDLPELVKGYKQKEDFEEQLQRLPDSIAKYPTQLVSNGYKTDIEKLALEAILKDEGAKRELQALIDQYYIEYAKIMREKSVESAAKIDAALNQLLQGQPISEAQPSWNFIKKVLATENQTQPLNTDTAEFLVRKELLKRQLRKKGKLDSADLQNIVKANILKADYEKTTDGYLFTTGEDGTSKGFIKEGKYLVKVDPIPGFDITIPKDIKVDGNSNAVVKITVKKGTGKVISSRSTHNSSGLISQVLVASTDTLRKPVTIAIVSDQDKQIQPWGGVQVSLQKQEQTQVIPLLNGWNLITLTALPDKPLTASGVITEIAKQGGYITTVSTLDNGAWKTYVARGDKQYSEDDFPIELGKAYFVKATKRSTFVFQGQQLVAPIKLSMKSGWNAVGLPKTSKSYSIGNLIDSLNNQKAQAQTAARYESGSWDAYLKTQEEFGNNFPIENKRGYVIRINKEVQFTP